MEHAKESSDGRYNEVIIKQAVNLAYQYIEQYEPVQEADERDRVNFAKFLLFKLQENPTEYVYSHEILDNLNAFSKQKINEHYFRSNIVSKLRDRGLLIASSNKGYKLPVCIEDLYDFVNIASLNIHPMIERITKCRDQILLATNNEVDILEKTEYDQLRSIVNLERVPF
ncbi:biotin operon repressor [Peribacillus deserti]|uniref:Biotin operon repressor n=1 Tax=Peribacillus deserti TaxID=673318 RepID=A0ABS2QH42_9BACI|nr:hypothetical protein [Peribacillus deserti]MBM7692478.1 biotin operon repressor [Peribacillus deserti]